MAVSRILRLLSPALALALGCSSHAHPSPAGSTPDASFPDASTTDGGTTIAFVAVTPSVYVAKVKNVLTGLAPTDDEIKQVAADPSQLRTLIAAWMQLPEYQSKIERFFELAFQQTQIASTDFSDQIYPRQQVALNQATQPLIVQNAQQSFPRTVQELVSEGRPLTDSATTQRFMMTTALKELYAFFDVWEVDDNGKVTDRFRQANPGLTITVGTAQGPIPMTDTLDPTSPNYMHWYNPDVVTAYAGVAGCDGDPIVYNPPNATALHYLLYGSLDMRKSSVSGNCQQFGGTAAAAQLTTGDFSDWTMVTVRQPAPGESITHFYDLPALRSATELVLTIPRVGFFSTPAFFANWPTNTSNQMRVTINQTLIVALGSSVDGTDSTVTPDSPPGLDTAHAGSAACSFCHRTLDPLRSILSATYSWNYHDQLDPAVAAQKGLFAFRGVVQPVNNVGDLGNMLATHPLFATAWAQKLCYYVNSAPCGADDPEFLRIVEAFKSSSYSFNTLVTELLSSPITTGASETQTADGQGEVVAVSRRDHLCAALDQRLGFTDVCGLDAVTKKQQQALIPSIATGLPSDGYGRGSVIPVLPNQPTLFYRAGLENICEAVAAQVIDVAPAKRLANVKQWSSTSPDAAIADFVSLVMALTPSDPRNAGATSVLKSHFTAAVAQGAAASDALKSTFVAACLAPSAISIGL